MAKTRKIPRVCHGVAQAKRPNVEKSKRPNLEENRKPKTKTPKTGEIFDWRFPIVDREGTTKARRHQVGAHWMRLSIDEDTNKGIKAARVGFERSDDVGDVDAAVREIVVEGNIRDSLARAL